jgi:predicted nucleic-acid-binding protein
MALADANVVLRYLLNDDEAMARIACEVIEDSAIRIPIEVLCEVVFVLQKVYRVSREEIATQLKTLARRANVTLARPNAILNALDFFAATNLDFVDCLLAGYAGEGEQIVTFDNKLSRFIEKLPRP